MPPPRRAFGGDSDSGSDSDSGRRSSHARTEAVVGFSSRGALSGRPSPPRGTLRLKLFYLPPMPSVPRNLLPENLTECIRGMQNAAWHASEPWMEGVLTQLGGDCRVSASREPCDDAEADLPSTELAQTACQGAGRAPHWLQ